MEGFAKPHFVGEQSAEIVPAEVPQPRDPEPLVRTELAVERSRNRSRAEGGQVAQRGAPAAPGFRGLKVGRELRHDVLHLRGVGGRNALDAAGSEAGIRFAAQCPLGRGEFLQLRGFKQEDLAVGLEVTAIACDRGAQRGLVGRARPASDRDGEIAVACRGHLGGDFRRAKVNRVFFEVRRDFGAEDIAQSREMGCEKIQRLVTVAQPPFAI